METEKFAHAGFFCILLESFRFRRARRSELKNCERLNRRRVVLRERRTAHATLLRVHPTSSKRELLKECFRTVEPFATRVDHMLHNFLHDARAGQRGRA